jgi:ankyrin repeat protein
MTTAREGIGGFAEGRLDGLLVLDDVDVLLDFGAEVNQRVEPKETANECDKSVPQGIPLSQMCRLVRKYQRLLFRRVSRFEIGLCFPATF